jgi:hypothetical protein
MAQHLRAYVSFYCIVTTGAKESDRAFNEQHFNSEQIRFTLLSTEMELAFSRTCLVVYLHAASTKNRARSAALIPVC